MENNRVYYVPFKAVDSEDLEDDYIRLENPNAVICDDSLLMPINLLLDCRSEVPLRRCFCGKLPELITYSKDGRTFNYYNCDSTIDEGFNHFLKADDAGDEYDARKKWNILMKQIDNCYGK